MAYGDPPLTRGPMTSRYHAGGGGGLPTEIGGEPIPLATNTIEVTTDPYTDEMTVKCIDTAGNIIKKIRMSGGMASVSSTATYGTTTRIPSPMSPYTHSTTFTPPPPMPAMPIMTHWDYIYSEYHSLVNLESPSSIIVKEVVAIHNQVLMPEYVQNVVLPALSGEWRVSGKGWSENPRYSATSYSAGVLDGSIHFQVVHRADIDEFLAEIGVLHTK